ncbi:MAG: T9SS type A sorting domain-containing protein [candidate division KSB1 bacterium]|nr:T9SS type A sorting domain-containing protein [candidate division KSB1 bacterium]
MKNILQHAGITAISIIILILFIFSSPAFTQKKGEKNDGFKMEPKVLVLDSKGLKTNPDEVHLLTPLVRPDSKSGRTEGNLQNWLTILSETFEGNFPTDNGWVLDYAANGYTWGAEAYNAYHGSRSGWCAGGSYAGGQDLNPASDNYPNNTDAWMVYGPFDLSDATKAEVNFNYWNYSELDYDYLFWGASLDSHYFYGYSISGYSWGWLNQNFDLTDVYTLGNLCGQSRVWLAFCFYSDRSITYKGAFIDDITLRKEMAGPPDIRIEPTHLEFSDTLGAPTGSGLAQAGNSGKGFSRPDNPYALSMKTGPHALGCIPTPAGWFARFQRMPRQKIGLGALPPSVDLSADMPPVGDQGNQGSCVAWATAYYYKTFHEKKERNWDLSTPAHQLSPSFMYNQINGGVDEGSTFPEAFELLVTKGCASLQDCPYDDSDYWSWPTEAAFEAALPYEAQSFSYFFDDQGQGGAYIEQMKQHLVNGDPIALAIPIYRPSAYSPGAFDNLNPADDFYEGPGSRDTYLAGGHAVILVGYDDAKGSGGFKMRNSWGTSWGNQGSAYLSYNFVATYAWEAWAMTDKIGYTPQATARIEIDHTSRGQLVVKLGVGSPGLPDWVTTVYDQQGGDFNNIYTVADATGGLGFLPPSVSHPWFLQVRDISSPDVGQLTTFEIHYKDSVYAATDLPLPINNYQTVVSYISGGGAVTGKTFTIYNDGGSSLQVTSITKEKNSPWLSFTPPTALPFSIPAGSWRMVSVSVDTTGLSPGSYSDRLLVYSNDPDESPYPDAVRVTLNLHQGQESLMVTSPNGGEDWEAGSSQTITWSSQNFTGLVKIEYSTDGGASWIMVTNSTGNSGSHVWVVPNTLSDRCLVKISDAVDGQPFDISDGFFSISSPVVVSDTLIVTSGQGLPGSSGNKVVVELVNTKEVAALQFNLKDIPNVLTASDGNTTLRTPGFTVDIQDKDTVVSIVMFNASGRVIAPGSGPVLEILCTVDSTAVLGTAVTLDLQGSLVSDKNAQLILVVEKDGIFTIGGLKGDVNADGIRNILDVIRLINIIQGRPPAPTSYELWAADCNNNGQGDGAINILDVVQLINWIVGKPLAKRSGTFAQEARLSLPQVELTPGGKADLPLIINSDCDLAGFQLKITYHPEQIKLLAPKLTERSQEMELVVSENEGQMMILLYNTSGKTIAAGSGSILNFSIEAKADFTGAMPLNLEEVVLANARAEAMSVEISAESIIVDQAIPKTYELGQNYPNPFNPETTIKYGLPERTQVVLKVFNLLGQEVRTLVDEVKDGGYHEVHWDGRDNFGWSLPAGIYVYRIEAGRFKQARKMALVK